MHREDRPRPIPAGPTDCPVRCRDGNHSAATTLAQSVRRQPTDRSWSRGMAPCSRHQPLGWSSWARAISLHQEVAAPSGAAERSVSSNSWLTDPNCTSHQDRLPLTSESSRIRPRLGPSPRMSLAPLNGILRDKNRTHQLMALNKVAPPGFMCDPCRLTSRSATEAHHPPRYSRYRPPIEYPGAAVSEGHPDGIGPQRYLAERTCWSHSDVVRLTWEGQRPASLSGIDSRCCYIRSGRANSIRQHCLESIATLIDRAIVDEPGRGRVREP